MWGIRQGIPIQEESGEGRVQGANWPPESGWGQAMLLVRAGRQGKTSSHTDDMQEPQARACKGTGGHAGWGCQQHEQYPAGAWLGPWPSW